MVYKYTELIISNKAKKYPNQWMLALYIKVSLAGGVDSETSSL
jgi:hypothetical protein